MARKQYDPAVSQEHVRQARERLEAAVETLMTDEGWQRYLRSQSKFHRYSWGNTLLIWSQNPEASHLRGFKGWLELGRCVRKGEHGIRILAPAGKGVRYGENAETGEAEVVASWTRFTTTVVFDLSQTDPLPDHPHPFDPTETPFTGAEVTGDHDMCVSLTATLDAWITDQGWSVAIGGTPEHPRANGLCRPSEKHIWIKAMSAPEVLSTLIHEAAHALTHSTVNTTDGYATGEVVAEATAFIVCDYFGLDAQAPAAEYIASWLSKDAAGFKKGLAAIQTTAHQMIDALSAAAA
jgi:antirestriction protein ArdC